MKIVADTPTLFSPEEGRQQDLTIIPACTIIDSQSYRDFEDISLDAFLQKIEDGKTPTTSQPSVGDVLDVYQSAEEEMLVLPIGDGLSGTYQNMESAKNMVENSQRIHVVDTQTLAGPQRYLVRKALKLREQGLDIERIIKTLQESIESSASFVIPVDFNFLKRSGRLTPVAAKIGSVLKIVPILTQTKDMKSITLFSIKRTKRKALEAIIEHFKSLGVNEDFLITVSHGGVVEEAKEIMQRLKEQFENTTVELFALAPSLVCHGGPGCLLIQTIRM